MADDRLREIERWAAAEGTLEAECELLRYRVREGDLSAAWLATAAHLGHKPARQVLGRFVPIATYATIRNSLARERWPRKAVLSLIAGYLEYDAVGKLERAALAVLAYAASGGAEERARCEELRVDAHDPTKTLLDCALTPEDVTAQQLCRSLLPPMAQGGYERPAPRGAGKLMREVLLPWVLEGRGELPPGLLPPDPAAWEGFGVAPAANEDPLRAFRKELERESTIERRRELEDCVERGILSRERLELAAYMGDPAAWRALTPEGQPDVLTPARPSLMAGSLLASLARLADGLPKDDLAREAILRGLRAYPEDSGAEEERIVYPGWWRALYAHLCLAIGEAVVARVESELDPRPATALKAAREFALTRGGGDAEAVREEATRSAACSRRTRLSGGAQAAARVAAWASRHVVTILTSAKRPSFQHRRQDMLQLALDAGLSEDTLWTLLRKETIRWALEPADEGVAPDQTRPYVANQTYALGELLQHPKFGRGTVVRVAKQRMDVEFEVGRKTLVMG